MTISFAERRNAHQIRSFIDLPTPEHCGLHLFINALSYLPGRPDSISQKALKFSNSRSSATSNVKVISAGAATVNLIFLLCVHENSEVIKRIVLVTDEMRGDEKASSGKMQSFEFQKVVEFLFRFGTLFQKFIATVSNTGAIVQMHLIIHS